MTSTGLVLGPLAFLLILLPVRFSITALPAFAMLDSAAVVNLGSFGLQPGYLLGLLIVGRTLVEIAVTGTPLNAHVFRRLLPLFLFMVVCFVSVWVGLTFFQGEVMVIGGAAGLNLDLVQPYSFQRQNLTQPFYLVLNTGIVCAVAQQIARMPVEVRIAVLDRSILGALFFVSAIAIWEMAGFYGGLPFFPDFFHSNAGYASAHGQVFSGGILRVSGPFAEPSSLAYHFAGLLFFAWYYYLIRPGTARMALIMLCLAIMAASTSTTAFAVLAMLAGLMVKDLVIRALTGGTSIHLSIRHLGIPIFLGLVVFGVLVFVQAHWVEIDGVLTRTLFEKSQTSSFADRSGVDRLAFDIVMETGGLGIGLGSHKPNNLVMTLLSNTGIAGFVMFAIFVIGVLRPSRSLLTAPHGRRFRWLVLGMLAVHAFSNPNLNPIMLWVGFALCIGMSAPDPRRRVAGGAVEDTSPESMEPRPDPC